MTDPALVDAATFVLDRDGFHGATFAAVAERAGRPVGEVEEAFGDVPRMFLACVDRFLAGQMTKYDDLSEGAATFEEAMRAYGRRAGVARLAGQLPSWDRVLVEFWIFASRAEPWRTEVRTRNTANLDRVGARLVAIADRYGLAYILEPREVARGVFSLGRGMGLEFVMDPTFDPEEFEHMFWAYVSGLVRPQVTEGAS
jgi:AcrR family transcriptional regulator